MSVVTALRQYRRHCQLETWQGKTPWGALKWNPGNRISHITSCSDLPGNPFWPNICPCCDCYFCRLFLKVIIYFATGSPFYCVYLWAPAKAWPGLVCIQTLGVKGVKSYRLTNFQMLVQVGVRCQNFLRMLNLLQWSQTQTFACWKTTCHNYLLYEAGGWAFYCSQAAQVKVNKAECGHFCPTILMFRVLNNVVKNSELCPGIAQDRVLGKSMTHINYLAK